MFLAHRLPVAVMAALFSVLLLGGCAAAELVAYASEAAAGTIMVKTTARRLYLIVDTGHAIQYTVGVGRSGSQWSGTSFIDGKFIQPNWAPPAAIRGEDPSLPEVIAGGSPSNPMGAAALTLAGGAYAIHGTNSPKSIGGFVSHGCIRMYNADIIDLFARVRIGTPVVVIR